MGAEYVSGDAWQKGLAYLCGRNTVALAATIYLFFAAAGNGEEPNGTEVSDIRPRPAAKPAPADPSFSHIMELPLHEALSMYGETIEAYMSSKDDEFTMDSWQPEFRIRLYNHYKPEQYLNTVIRIKEVTWRYAADEKITVWYERQPNNTYLPKDSLIYSDDMEF